MEDWPHAGHFRRRERSNTGTMERLSFVKLTLVGLVELSVIRGLYGPGPRQTIHELHEISRNNMKGRP